MARQASSRDRIRKRIEQALERELAFLSVAPRVGREVPEGGTSERVVEQLVAFRATGLLSEEETDDWRARFARAAHAVSAPDEDVVTPELRARATELLDAHLSGLASRAQHDRDRDESARFHAMIAALKDVGALTEAEADDFIERRSSILGKPRRRPPSEKPPPPPRLLRVVVGPAERKSGVRVTAAELFDSSVRLWWHRTISPEEVAEREREQAANTMKALQRKPHRAARRFELSDDLGTPYEAHALGSDEDTPWLWMTMWRVNPDEPQPLPLFGRATFTPPVPEEARRLVAVSGQDRFVLDLAA